jgi:hypothetical protein
MSDLAVLTALTLIPPSEMMQIKKEFGLGGGGQRVPHRTYSPKDSSGAKRVMFRNYCQLKYQLPNIPETIQEMSTAYILSAWN